MKRSDLGDARGENLQPPTSNTQRATADKSVQEILTVLHKWGIHTLGQLAVLDRGELRARLGTEAARMWERANGLSTRLLKFVQPPESFEENFEFENETETAEPLLFMLRRFLEQLALRLSTIYLVAQQLTLRITFANKQTYQRIFQIPQSTNDVDLLFQVLHTHLENFKSEYPITGVSLEAQPTKPPEQQFGFFDPTLRNPHQLSETLARLSVLLGADRVGKPILEDTHRPDAFRMEPFSWRVGAIDLNRPKAIEPTSRIALRRFRPAASASVFLSENIPAHVRSVVLNAKIVDQRGPYLLSGNWWDEKSWTCAKWELQLENGILCHSHQSGENWQIDGVYD
jgi:protein ImuB